jgi:hypothetical protein
MNETEFLARVQRGDGCWGFTGNGGDGEYHRVRWHGRLTTAHRIAWELARCPIPAELVIDHLCRNRGCVNPSHMEVVDMATNTLRGESPPARNARQMTCSRGHAFETVLSASGRRRCRQCDRDRAKATGAAMRRELKELRQRVASLRAALADEAIGEEAFRNAVAGAVGP